MPCKYEQFKATVDNHQRKSNVLFCHCAGCHTAREYSNTRRLIRPTTPQGIIDRIAALNWKPETKADADGKVGE